MYNKNNNQNFRLLTIKKLNSELQKLFEKINGRLKG